MSVDVRGVCTVLKVHQMLASVQFYRDELGFTVVKASEAGDEPSWVWLRINAAELLLNRAHDPHQRPATRDPARVTAHGDTALYFDCPDVDSTCDYLRMRGLDVKGPVVAQGMKRLYLSDPDGYLLCFQSPAR